MEETNRVEKHLLEEHEIKESDVKLYKIRWIILGIYIMYAAMNSFQWFEYSIIANIVMRYYNVSSVAVDWTSIIYDILYMPMVIPASYFIDKKVSNVLLSRLLYYTPFIFIMHNHVLASLQQLIRVRIIYRQL